MAQCTCAVPGRCGRVLYSFVRLEKGEIRNKDRRDVSPEENTVPRLVPQVIASDPEELKVLTDFWLRRAIGR